MYLSDPRYGVFWGEFRSKVSGDPSTPALPSGVFSFDNTKHGAAVSALAVLEGRKTATSALALPFDRGDDRFPEPGDHEIVTLYDGTPYAVIRISHWNRVCFGKVDHAFAEADGAVSLEDWKKTQYRCYGPICRSLGAPMNDDTELLRIYFQVVYPEPMVLDARCADTPVMLDRMESGGYADPAESFAG